MGRKVRVIQLGTDEKQWAVEHRADEHEFGADAYTQENLPTKVVKRDGTGVQYDTEGATWTVADSDDWYVQTGPNEPIPSAEVNKITELEVRIGALESIQPGSA